MDQACNFCAHEDQAVVELGQDSFKDEWSVLCIVEKHFWFTNDELKSFYICDICRKKLLEFHQFYCQVKQLYSANSGVDKDKLRFVSIKTEQSEKVDIKSEIEDIEDDDFCETKFNEESSDTLGNDNQFDNSNDKNPEDQSDEKALRRAINDEDIRIFCKMVCHICTEEFDYFGHLKDHCKQVHNTRCYVQCCKNRFYDVYRLQEHVLVHLNPDIFRCEKCNLNLCSKRSLIRHQTSAVHLFGEKKVFECNVCQKSFSKQYSLNGHMNLHQTNSISTSQKCTLCPKEFTSFEKLCRHVKTAHKTVVCYVCNMTFDSESSLNVHRASDLCVDPQLARIPSGLCVRKCTICNKTFNRKLKYKEHMAIHAGKFLYSCEFCAQQFKASDTFQYHRKNKHAEEWKKLKSRKYKR